MKKANSGKGKEIPPLKDHVVIWFLQNGASEQLANNFFYFYKKGNWIGKKGRLIRDWKMYAWHWIWKD